MISTWRQRMYRAVQTYIRQSVLEEDHVIVVKRALYFSQYRVAIHFAPTVANWTDFNDLLAHIHTLLKDCDCRVVSSARALYFNVYTNDPQVVNLLRSLEDMVDFNSLHVIDPSCWEIKHPRPKNKGPYYHRFTYRVRLSEESKLTPETYHGLMQASWTTARCFFYCNEVRDLLMFKLLHSQDIVDISERQS